MRVPFAGLLKEGHGGGRGVSRYQGCKEVFILKVTEDFRGREVRQFTKRGKWFDSSGSHKFKCLDEVC